MTIKPAIDQRLAAAALRVRVRKSKLVQQALEAAVESIERNGGKLVWPIEFTVRYVPDGTPSLQVVCNN